MNPEAMPGPATSQTAEETPASPPPAAETPVAKPAKAAARRAPTKAAARPAAKAAPAQKTAVAGASKPPASREPSAEALKSVKTAKADKHEKSAKPMKPAKPEKAPKAKKPNLVRDSFTMPEAEYALLATLKKRCLSQGLAAKKSELLRAAVAALGKLDDAALSAAVRALAVIKTGRPAKGAK